MMCEDCKHCIDCSQSDQFMTVNRDRTLYRPANLFIGKMCDIAKKPRYDFVTGEYKCKEYEIL